MSWFQYFFQFCKYNKHVDTYHGGHVYKTFEGKQEVVFQVILLYDNIVVVFHRVNFNVVQIYCQHLRHEEVE